MIKDGNTKNHESEKEGPLQHEEIVSRFGDHRSDQTL